MLFIFKVFWSNCRLRFARTLAEGRWSRVMVPVVIALLLTAGTALSLRYAYGKTSLSADDARYEGTYQPVDVFDAAYYLLFTNGGQNMYDKDNHWLGIVITSLGIIFIAILTSMITNAFDRIGERYLAGESTYYMDGHIVIVGTSDVIYSILNSLKSDSKTRLLILTGKNVAEKRREILSFLENDSFKKRMVFMYGDRTSKKDMARLSLSRAKEVFIIGDSEERDGVESYRDSNNMDCVEIIANDPHVKKYRKGANKLPCHVMFEYQTTFVAFQFSEMGDTYRENIDFLPFNFYDMWARNVLVAGGVETSGKYKYLDTLPGGGYIQRESDETVHLIVVGMTKIGIALGLQAAQVCHYPNFIRDKSKRTRITFIDADADIEFNYMNGRYRNLFQHSRNRLVDLSVDKEFNGTWNNEDSWLDVEWEFLKGRVESPEIQAYIEKACNDKSRIVTLAICLYRSHQSIATAMFLPEGVFRNSLQVLVYQRLSGTIIDKIATPLKDKDQYRYMNLRPFGMIDCGYYPQVEKELNERAKYVSYVYDSYYRTTEEGKEVKQWDEKLDDYGKLFLSYGEYADYEEFWAREKKVWEKISSQFNAAMMETRLRSIGIDLRKDDMDTIIARIQKELPTLQEVEHNRWNTEKLMTGYRALSKEEYDKLLADWEIWHDSATTEEEAAAAEKRWRKYRKLLKEWPHRAHLDICPFEQLKIIEEEDIILHDARLNEAIPYILRKEGKI